MTAGRISDDHHTDSLMEVVNNGFTDTSSELSPPAGTIIPIARRTREPTLQSSLDHDHPVGPDSRDCLVDDDDDDDDGTQVESDGNGNSNLELMQDVEELHRQQAAEEMGGVRGRGTGEQRVLIISNTGGGAHESLARNIMKQLQSSTHKTVYHKKDFLSKDLNYFFIKRIADKHYNQASVRGKARNQALLMSTRFFGEIIFIPVVYEKMLRLLLKLKPTRVVCVEPVGLIPMVRAVCTYNSIQRRMTRRYEKRRRGHPGSPIIPEFELWMTDMPTVYAQHTFQSLRFMMASDRKIVKLYTPPPLLWRTRAINDEEFWWQQCRFKARDGDDSGDICGHVRYLAFTKTDLQRGMPLSISPKFIEQEPKVGKSVDIPIRFASAEERQMVWHSCHDLLDARTVADPSREAIVKINSNDMVVSCMLSSRPNALAMLGYISMIVEEVGRTGMSRKEEKDTRLDTAEHNSSDGTTAMNQQAENGPERVVFFLFCGKHVTGQRDSTMARIAMRVRHLTRTLQVRNADDPRPLLRFVPLGFQDPDVVATVTARSNVNIRQSGGLSCMEIIAMAKSAKEHKMHQKWLIHVEVFSPRQRVSAERLRQSVVEKYRERNRSGRGTFGRRQMDESTTAKEEEEKEEEEALFSWLFAHSFRKWEAANAQYLRQAVGAKAANPCISPSSILMP